MTSTPRDEAGPSTGTPPGEGVGRTARRRLLADRLATGVVNAGGFAVVASLVGILAFLLYETLPLFRGATVIPGNTSIPIETTPLALLIDPHQTHIAALDETGGLSVFAMDSGAEVAHLRLSDGTAAVAVDVDPRARRFSLATRDGHVRAVVVDWRLSYRGRQRIVTPQLRSLEELHVESGGASLISYALRGDEQRSTVAAVLDDDTLALLSVETEVNDFTGEHEVTRRQERVEAPPGLTHLLIGPDQRDVYGASEQGAIYWWEIRSGGIGRPRRYDAGGPVSSMAFLIGGRALVVGTGDGAISIWCRVPRGTSLADLAQVRRFDTVGGTVRQIATSERERSFLVHTDEDRLALFHSTSDRLLWSGNAPIAAASAVAFAPKGDGAALARAGWLLPLEVENAHPEAGLRAFFSKIWYEDSPSPEWVWQSTGGTDEFEPKLSLTPLVFGTLKATLYALIFAVPLGILGATCSSQFLAPALQSLVKPTVELMASLPSVVLGFLGGLWLAPRLERVFPGLLLMIIVLPLLSILTGGLWRALPRRLSGRLPEGGELFFYALVLLLGMFACIELSAPFEALAFSGDFSSWLQQATGLGYDQRNAVVAGIAMGFAVIPIIFAISDDALSNVPADLSAASLALGATRWQTVARIVLPAASPGIFAAVMIGLGRAVGETMIVLMATGNTPVLDWNAFNGFRTLSANIAVEIPEAPQGGTLYRTLFLSAVLLFAVTFLINTAAELVRERIRRRFAGQG